MEHLVVVSNLGDRHFKNARRLHTRAALCNLDTGEIMTDRLEFHFVELPNLPRKKLANVTRVEKWLPMLMCSGRYLQGDIPPELAREEAIKTSIERHRRANSDQATRQWVFPLRALSFAPRPSIRG